MLYSISVNHSGFMSDPAGILPAGLSHEHQRKEPATYFTEMENSPGALSLSRIRKAPKCLRFKRISSARCLEILPAYHLEGSHKEPPLSRRWQACDPPHTSKNSGQAQMGQEGVR